MKPQYQNYIDIDHLIFILLSIKTRIETKIHIPAFNWDSKFLSYYPLKQGLKPEQYEPGLHPESIFILLSIKTRIETGPAGAGKTASALIFILLSIKTRIETGATKTAWAG